MSLDLTTIRDSMIPRLINAASRHQQDSIESLMRWYYDQGWSSIRVADDIKCGTEWVLRRWREMGLPKRSRTILTGLREHPYKPTPDHIARMKRARLERIGARLEDGTLFADYAASLGITNSQSKEYSLLYNRLARQNLIYRPEDVRKNQDRAA